MVSLVILWKLISDDKLCIDLICVILNIYLICSLTVEIKNSLVPKIKEKIPCLGFSLIPFGYI